jgi:excisionase family DNA binding protein
MDQDLYTVSEVAERLKLHTKTVLAFVRDGRLKATRVGKQYRIARNDLDAFTGQRPTLPDGNPAGRHRHVEVSSIVEIDAIDRAAVDRTVTHLLGALNARAPGDARTRVDAIYYEEIARLKLIVSGSTETTAYLLGLVPVLIAD